MYMFQFLIGNLITVLKKRLEEMAESFQFLIGNLITDTYIQFMTTTTLGFQFLIGNLITFCFYFYDFFF